MQTKRLFIGAYIDRDIFEYYMNDIQEDLKGITFGKWVEYDNLHFTLKFLGDTDENIITQIIETLGDELKLHNSPIEFKGLGAFPNLRNPRVLFANMLTKGNILTNLANSIANKLAKFGFAKETKEFKPHLTLQRLKDFNSQGFSDVVESYKETVFGNMDSFTVNIIESKLTKSGPIYFVIK